MMEDAIDNRVQDTRRILLAGTVETLSQLFTEHTVQESLDYHMPQRVRVILRKYNGKEIRTWVLNKGSSKMNHKIWIPFSARSGELVYESQQQCSEHSLEWIVQERVVIDVCQFSVESHRGAYKNLWRHFVGSTCNGYYRGIRYFSQLIIRCLLLIPKRKQDSSINILMAKCSPAWRTYLREADATNPRAAWANVTTRLKKERIWLISRSPGKLLGQLYQYKDRTVRFDALPAGEIAMENTLKLTVVTPSYNQAQFLKHTMESVFQSNKATVDYIVMDGGSSDGSVAIIQSYDRRLKYWQSRPDGGQASAIRAGFEHIECSCNDIMAYLNSDDMLAPGAVDFVLEWFAEHPEVDAIYGHRIIVDENGREVGRWVLPPHDSEVLRLIDFVPQETLFWRRRIHDLVGGFDATFQFAMDWDFLLRIQEAGAKIVRVPWFLGCFRVHSEQKTQAAIHSVGAEEIEYLRKRTNGDPDKLPTLIHEALMKSQVEGYWYRNKLEKGERI